MGIYEFIDNFGISIGALIVRSNKYFSKGIESKKIFELINEIEIVMPEIREEGYYKVIVNYEGKTYEAGFRIEQWIGDNCPTIIYHHGAAEGSYDFSFNRIFKKNKDEISANLIAIQALFSHSNKAFFESIPYLSNYTLMLASSVLIVENLIRDIRKKSEEKIIVSGTSLGGFVSSLHFAYYNTADIYKPILSGTRLGEVFLDSAYTKVTSKIAKQNPSKIRNILNFGDDLRNKEQSKLCPLMAKYDQIVKLNSQSLDFNEKNLKLIPYGHATGATKFKLLRDYVIDGIEQ